MSTLPAQTFPVVHYTHLSDLLQEVQRETPDSLFTTVRITPMELNTSGGRMWGVLLTALPLTTIHMVWIAVDVCPRLRLSTYREEQAKVRQNRQYMRLVAYVQQLGVTVRPGAYVVPDSAFRVSAEIPADLLRRQGEGEPHVTE